MVFDCIYPQTPSLYLLHLLHETDMERPFTVAFSFGVVLIVLPYLGDFVVLPVWNNLNIGVCFMAIVLCVAVYFTEYLAIFPINYRWTCIVLHTDLVKSV